MNTITYESDFYQWTQQQADRLRHGQWATLDAANLAEEIESMGKSDRRAIASYLANILFHLLKWQYQPDRRGTSWQLSIDNCRYQTSRRLKESPSLNPQLSAMMEEEYPQARKNASRETGLPLSTFPEQCPFNVEQIINDFWPE